MQFGDLRFGGSRLSPNPTALDPETQFRNHGTRKRNIPRVRLHGSMTRNEFLTNRYIPGATFWSRFRCPETWNIHGNKPKAWTRQSQKTVEATTWRRGRKATSNESLGDSTGPPSKPRLASQRTLHIKVSNKGPMEIAHGSTKRPAKVTLASLASSLFQRLYPLSGSKPRAQIPNPKPQNAEPPNPEDPKPQDPKQHP